MLNIVKRMIEYSIRHLKLNTVCTRLVDTLFKDRVNTQYQGAKELLRNVYEPAAFKQNLVERQVKREYNLQIIIPMYNAQKYIKQCIDSVLNQETDYTYVIYLVDDGSTDGTIEFVTNTFQDERIQIIRQKNSGTASARNAAMKALVADYIMFIDADDMLKKGAINSLLHTAYEKEADIVEGGYELFRKKVIKQVAHDNMDVNEPCGKLWGFSWAKVISANLFKDFMFPDDYWYEDTFIAYLIYTRCKHAVTIQDVVYSYRNNRKGFSRIRGRDKKMLDAFWIINLVIDELVRREIPFSQSIYEQLLVSISTSSKRIMCLETDLRRCVLAAYCELLHNTFPQYSTSNDSLKIFEKVIKNNDYRKYRFITLCLENL